MNKPELTDPGVPPEPQKPPKQSYAKKSGVNYANEAPRKIKGIDAAYIDHKLKHIFRNHAMNVHNKHMDLVRNVAQRNARRKIP